MGVSFRFKTITVLLLSLFTFIFLISFLISVFYDSKKVINNQISAHSEAMADRHEDYLRSYLDYVEENFLTIRSNDRMIESFYEGDLNSYLETLSDWEEDFERIHYDFVAVSFLNTGKCFLFSGYFTKLATLSCADLFIKNGGLDNYGWKVISVEDKHLGIYSTTLSLRKTGKVIGQLIGGIKLTDNNYLLEKITAADRKNIHYIDIIYDGLSINHLTFPQKELTWHESILADATNKPAFSEGNTAFGSRLRIKVISNDTSIASLRNVLSETLLFGSIFALLISFLIALILSRFVDIQLQSLIVFARKANINKRTQWRKTRISDFNDIGEEIIQIVKDLKDKEDKLAQVNIDLRDIASDKRRILHHLIKSQENERLRISNELHDDMGQLLAAVRINMIFLRDELDKNHMSIEDVNNCLNIVNSMYDTVYNRIMSLRPFEMNDFGLDISIPKIPAIQQLEHMDYAIMMDLDQKKKLTEEVMSNLYRIAQEALSNTMKHAKGTYVLIRLKDEEKGLRMVIEDDGVGLPVTGISDTTTRGFGLMSIKERAEYINAQLVVGQGEDDEGVSIDIFIPSEYAYEQAQAA